MLSVLPNIFLLCWILLVGVSVGVDEMFKTCTSNCSLNFMNEYQNLTNQSPSAIPGLLLLLDAASQAEPDRSSAVFDALCNLCENYAKCLTVCEEPLRGLIEEGLAPIRFLCATKRQEYKEALPCLVQSDSKIRGECETKTKQLWPIASSVQNIRDLPLTLRPNILALYCSLTTQYMDCTIPAVQANCGNQSAELISQVQDISLNRIAIFLQNPPQSPVPDTCSGLIARAGRFMSELKQFTKATVAPAEDATTAADGTNNNHPVLINKGTSGGSLHGDLAKLFPQAHNATNGTDASSSAVRAAPHFPWTGVLLASAVLLALAGR